jgi:hypothetical protein
MATGSNPPPTSIINPINAIDQHDRVFYFMICPVFVPYYEELMKIDLM